MSPTDRLARRALPGASWEVSEVALRIALPNGPAAPTPRSLADEIRYAHRVGVTTFDLGGHRPGESAAALDGALEGANPEIVVLLPLDADPGRATCSLRGAPPPEGGTVAAVTASIAPVRQRLPSRAKLVGLAGPTLAGTPRARELLNAAVADGVLDAWAADLEGPGGSPSGSPNWAAATIVAPFSLLDRRIAEEMPASWAETGRVIARDPFARGRLDGRRLGASLSDRRPDVGPTAFRTLQGELAPILDLAYLTSDRRRSLPEAALEYVLAFPWVATTVLDPPIPRGVLERRSRGDGTPFSATERRRLGLPAAGS